MIKVFNDAIGILVPITPCRRIFAVVSPPILPLSHLRRQES